MNRGKTTLKISKPAFMLLIGFTGSLATFLSSLAALYVASPAIAPLTAFILTSAMLVEVYFMAKQS